MDSVLPPFLTARKPVDLALYCDQALPDDAEIDQALLVMLKRKGSGKRVGYVPSGPESDRYYFRDRRAYYARYGLDLETFCDLDEPDVDIRLKALLDCDAIHLTGGDTASFLQRLRASGALHQIRDWALGGGVLVGTSAGAILMAPTIAVDALFVEHHPEDVTDSAALDLVPFDFFPHLNASPAFLPALLRYSLTTQQPIIACRDGEGVVVEQGKPTVFGQPLLIRNGEITALNKAAAG